MYLTLPKGSAAFPRTPPPPPPPEPTEREGGDRESVCEGVRRCVRGVKKRGGGNGGVSEGV